ncbi:MAG: manganese-binding transcriptional regulator MntR [Terrimicrobiaceae bacterium]
MKNGTSPGHPDLEPPLAMGRDTAAHQRRTRLAHAQERAQDYVEAIAELILEHGEARATELARALGVTHVTVVRTVQRLQKEGLVTSRPYRSIFLTEAGRKLASKAKARHATVIAFLESLGISAATARADAEGIEHHVSPETLAAFERQLSQNFSPKPARKPPARKAAAPRGPALDHLPQQ